MLITTTFSHGTRGPRIIVATARGQRKSYPYDHSASSRQVYVDQFLQDTGIGPANPDSTLLFVDSEGSTSYFALVDLRC